MHLVCIMLSEGQWHMAVSCRTVSNTSRAEQEANVGAEKLRLAKILQVGVLLEPTLAVHHVVSSFWALPQCKTVFVRTAGPLLFSKRGRRQRSEVDGCPAGELKLLHACGVPSCMWPNTVLTRVGTMRFPISAISGVEGREHHSDAMI
jgi:hypothetical protein